MHYYKMDREVQLTKDGGQLGQTCATTANHTTDYAPGHVWLQTKPTGVAPSTETRRRGAKARREGRRDEQELPAEPGHGHPLSIS